MCLAVPMKVTGIEGKNATVLAGGVTKEVRLDLLDGVGIGDYVLIHTGYAIERIDRDEALETLELIREVYRAGMTGKGDPSDD
ncbi:MAG TPA: HypC/HybG/HupF family hydrogenase formation chaperone [Candidatus Krumholzibacterium sp.]|nr:HypC/HybG/HupF family hydrogenase formation chaperone [Candidatus Krumholzibacterium sp.]